MSNKHTPGEWATKESIVYSLENGQDIARCDIGGRDEQTEANARLIAAASELLKALHTVMQDIEHAIDNADLSGLPETTNTIREAINKAIGE